MELAVSSLNVSRKDQSQTHSQFASDAGIDEALQTINQNSTWTGTAGEIVLHNENNIKTTYQVTVANNPDGTKTLTSTGRTFRPAASTTPITSRVIKADLRPITTGLYSIVTGVGGLYMSNSSKIVGGDVLVNGEIIMSGSAQIGLTTNPVKVEVAHQNCPVPGDATYPRLCISGENGEPISIVSPARIYGTVKANNQTNGANMTNPGLVAGSVAVQPLPTHDRAAQKAAVTSTTLGPLASCNSGSATWPANYKITGDVTIQNSCKVTISGDVWITGKLNVKNIAQIIVSNSLGATMPNIMVDGETVNFSNAAQLKSNNLSTGAQLLNYYSKASCSPDCASVTGADLYNSRSEETINFDNSSSAPQSKLYARWTRVVVQNSGGIGALIGQTVELRNNSTITFGTAIGTATTYWVIDVYRRGL